jgi:hypothetical protein
MKKFLKPELLPLLTLAAGMMGMLLQLWQYVGGTDEKGLILRGHISAILLGILTVFVLALILLGTWGLREGNQYRFNFPASLPGCVGAGLAAIMIFVTAVGDLIARQDFLILVTGLVGLVAGASMVAMSIGRLRGRQVCFLFPLAVCLFLMMHLICQYRVWSGEPQIMSYCYPLLATVCVMLSAYQDAAFAGNFGNRRAHAALHLAAVYFCCASLIGDHTPLFYLAMGVWMLTDMCRLLPMPRSYARGEEK